MPPRSSSPICERSFDLTLIEIGRRDIPQCSPKHFIMQMFYRTFSSGRRPSGYNRVSITNIVGPPTAPSWYVPASTEYVFIYDISAPAAVKKQVLTIPNTYNGIVFDPSGTAFYVS